MSWSEQTEAVFQDIFTDVVPETNEDLMAKYLAKKKGYRGAFLADLGPWILEYEARGESWFTSARTPQEAIDRTNEKEPDGWLFNNITTEKEWFSNHSNSLKRGQRTNHDNSSLRTITNDSLEEPTPQQNDAAGISQSE